MADTHAQQIGEMVGLMRATREDLQYIREKVDSLDGRVRAVERKAAKNGAVSGGIMSIAVAGIAAVVRQQLGG